MRLRKRPKIEHASPGALAVVRQIQDVRDLLRPRPDAVHGNTDLYDEDALTSLLCAFFDPLFRVLGLLKRQLPAMRHADANLEQLTGKLVAIDASYFKKAGDIAWALRQRRADGTVLSHARLDMQLDVRRWAPEMFAVHGNKMGTIVQVGQAIAASADVNAKDTNGKSILEYGRENKNSKVLAELIKAGGQVAAHTSHLGRRPRRNKRRVPLPSTRQAEAAAPVEQPCSKSIVHRGYATFFFSWFSELRRSFCAKEKVDGWRTIRQKDSSSFY